MIQFYEYPTEFRSGGLSCFTVSFPVLSCLRIVSYCDLSYHIVSYRISYLILLQWLKEKKINRKETNLTFYVVGLLVVSLEKIQNYPLKGSHSYNFSCCKAVGMIYLTDFVFGT